jgi:Leucine-rich repeat (LRR) protein
MAPQTNLALLLSLSLIAAPIDEVKGQLPTTQPALDCAIADRLWKQMGKTTTLPSNCCDRQYKIACVSSRIHSIEWTSQGLHNSISDDICSLDYLWTLRLDSNQLTGSIPACLGRFPRLRNLHLQQNSLSGAIPAELAGARNLNQLFLNNNNLTGPIPSFHGTRTKDLAVIYLQNNQLTGNIPASLQTLPILSNLRFFNNLLTGFPSNLLSVKATEVKIYANPMPTTPFDGTSPISDALVQNYTWVDPAPQPATDCAVANRLWRQFGKTTTLPSNCCDHQYRIYCVSNRIHSIEWAFQGLQNSISNDVCQLDFLWTLRLDNNQLTGSIPACLGRFPRLRNLHLQQNSLSGDIPAELAGAKNLNQLLLNNNNLTGPIPSFDGTRTKDLSAVHLQNNQLTGTVPFSFKTLPILSGLLLYNNQLSGYPSDLLTFQGNLQLFPNPMSTVPYDILKPASIGLIEDTMWTNFVNTPVASKKRQITTASAPVTTEELVQLCPLNNVQDSNVAAGCAAGIYQKFCTKPTDPILLSQCHDAYDRAFGASFFKSIGEVCPAWKSGPKSFACASAVKSFSYSYLVGTDPFTQAPIYLKLTSTHAAQLVKNIFSSPTYAPCVAPFICAPY